MFAVFTKQTEPEKTRQIVLRLARQLYETSAAKLSPSFVRVVLLHLVLFGETAAQYRFDSWTTGDGLPQNSVNALVQTRDGYLWVGTFGGLARFDGVRFTVFNTINAPALRSQRVTALYEDRAGTLWIGTESGEVSFYRDGEFTAFDAGEPLTRIYTFYQDSRGLFWIAAGSGARRYALAESNHAVWHEKIVPSNGDRYNSHVSGIAETPDGSIWLDNISVEENNQGRIVRWRENAAMQIFTAGDGLSGNPPDKSQRTWFNDLAVDRAGTLWVSDLNGLARFDGTRFVNEFRCAKQNFSKSNFAADADGDLRINLNDRLAQLVAGRWGKRDFFPESERKSRARFSLTAKTISGSEQTNSACSGSTKLRSKPSTNRAES